MFNYNIFIFNSYIKILKDFVFIIKSARFKLLLIYLTFLILYRS
jgi:hypothetical protein